MAKTELDLNKMIQDGRERKKNETLANRIFGRDRRQSAPSAFKGPAAGSLASRIKPKNPQTPTKRTARASLPASGNINGEWTHDLHDSRSSVPRGRTLASRVEKPGRAGAALKPNMKKQARLAAVLDRMDVDDGVKGQVNVVKPKAPPMGMNIRGLAGPFVLMAQNFAPGTTLADIESAMTPIGGEIVTSRIVKTDPIMVVEMAFVSREGGEEVIRTFNDKTADGRLIKVFPRPGGSAPQRQQENKQTRDQVIDGSMGFGGDRGRSDRGDGARASNDRPLYSDKIVAGSQRGRGFGRGRGGR